jgi:hypothetical protein
LFFNGFRPFFLTTCCSSVLTRYHRISPLFIGAIWEKIWEEVVWLMLLF